MIVESLLRPIHWLKRKKNRFLELGLSSNTRRLNKINIIKNIATYSFISVHD